MNVIVTGGSRGIGRDIVLKFVNEGYGCAFTFVGNQAAADETIKLALQIDSGALISAHQLNVRHSADVETVIEEIIDQYDTIDAVVNNAAVVRDNAAVLLTDEQWTEVIDTNLSGPFYIIRALLMHFLSNKGGRIINISSLAQGGASGQINYAASKAGLIGITKTVAKEYGAKGITANVVGVGLVETDMVRDNMSETIKNIWLQYCPMKRTGKASEIASLVHYLTTKTAGFINGEVINVAGGLTYIP